MKKLIASVVAVSVLALSLGFCAAQAPAHPGAPSMPPAAAKMMKMHAGMKMPGARPAAAKAPAAAAKSKAVKPAVKPAAKGVKAASAKKPATITKKPGAAPKKAGMAPKKPVAPKAKK